MSPSAFWNLLFAGFAWVGILALIGGGILIQAPDDDRTAFLMLGIVSVVVMATLASLALALHVLITGRRGMVPALLALIVAAPPFFLIAATIVRAIAQ